MQIIVRVIAIIVAVIMSINAIFMLISPRAWFQLPNWLRAQGVLTQDKYGTGLRALQIRVIGGIILFLVAGISYDVITELVHR
jgi:hypothetical protein